MGDFISEKINQPIRRKNDMILLLLETMKLFENPDNIPINELGKITIYVDKMSRIFYETKEKYFSFIFPFLIETHENTYKFYDNSMDCELNSRILSMLISIFRQNCMLENSLEKAMDTIIEIAEEYEYQDIDTIWRLIFKLWYMEEGYIRYDYDDIHVNGKFHPLCHLDINYSSEVTYKIGLNNTIQMNAFKDILDLKTECAYLKN